MRWDGAEPVYRLVIAFAVTVFRLLRWRVRISGAEHVPGRGPAILAANHIGLMDFVFIGYGARAGGRVVRFMARHEAFAHWLSGPLMRAMRHIPVDREGDPSTSLRTALDALEAGQVIGVHPEGTISHSFVVRAGKTGAVRLAQLTGAPIIPTAVWGAQRLLPRGRRPRFPRGVAIDVRFGPAMQVSADDDPVAATRRLMAAITTLVEQAVAEYPQVPRPGDDWWLPAHLGGSAPTPEESDAQAARRRADRLRRA